MKEYSPLISIITVVYNGEEFLENTIQSVINQSYKNIEYIMIDGGSSDKTVDIIKKYEEHIAYWVSEKDGGIYDAMNKGIKVASGELIGLINADDYYVNDIIKIIANKYIEEKFDVVYGDIYYFDAHKEFIVPAHNTGLKYGFSPYSFKWIWANMLFGHPTTFIKKEIYNEVGLYDTTFRISGDYDFIFKLVQLQKKFYYLKKPIAYFRLGGVSTTVLEIKDRENEKIRENNGFIVGSLVNFVYRSLQSMKRLRDG